VNGELPAGPEGFDTGTVAGVGPTGWRGRATLNPQPTVPGQALTVSGTTAYPPMRFATSAGASVALVHGYSGTVSFTNAGGQRLWTAWAVAAVPVKISGMVQPDATQICGTGAAGTR